MACKHEKSNLLVVVFESWDCDVHEGDASFNKSLRLLSVLSFDKRVAFSSQLQHLIYQALSHTIQINKKASRIRINIQSFVQISPVVNFLNDLIDYA